MNEEYDEMEEEYNEVKEESEDHTSSWPLPSPPPWEGLDRLSFSPKSVRVSESEAGRTFFEVPEWTATPHPQGHNECS